MDIKWLRNADEAVQQAQRENKPLYLDFSAAPM